MVGHLNELNQNFVERLQNTAAALSQYAHPSVANYMGQYTLYRQLIQQSTLWAFMDAFRIFGMLCLIVIPLLLLIKKRRLS